MAVTRKEEGRALSNEERDIVARTRHPEIQKLPDDALSSLVKRLRDMRDRARSQANQQRREVRGKSEPEGGAPKTSSAGSSLKASVLAASLKRLNAELQRRASMSRNHALVENARHALELKQHAQKNNMPYNTRFANQGMRDIPDKKVSSLVRPAERGRLRKEAAVTQSRRDAAD